MKKENNNFERKPFNPMLKLFLLILVIVVVFALSTSKTFLPGNKFVGPIGLVIYLLCLKGIVTAIIEIRQVKEADKLERLKHQPPDGRYFFSVEKILEMSIESDVLIIQARVNDQIIRLGSTSYYENGKTSDKRYRCGDRHIYDVDEYAEALYNLSEERGIEILTIDGSEYFKKVIHEL